MFALERRMLLYISFSSIRLLVAMKSVEISLFRFPYRINILRFVAVSILSKDGQVAAYKSLQKLGNNFA
jgi:hypothetical protein